MVSAFQTGLKPGFSSLSARKAEYDARGFNWIGAPASETSVCVASPTSAFKTIDDTFRSEMVTGTAGTSTYDFPVVLNNVLGARLKLVKGYAGNAALRLKPGEPATVINNADVEIAEMRGRNPHLASAL